MNFANVNIMSDDFVAAARAILKAKGYTYVGMQRRSAIGTYVFKKGEQEVHFDRWHGTGTPGTNRFWGSRKDLHALYVRVKFKSTHVIDAKTTMIDDVVEVEKRTKAFVTKALALLNTL